MNTEIIANAKEKSLIILDELRKKMHQTFPLECGQYQNICVYACGSLGRLEMTENSDLDLFFISLHDSKIDPMGQNLNKYIFFSKLYEINRAMGFPDPSKGGEYWSIINKMDFLDIGSRKEDFNNSFTARLLFMLESKPLYNERIYNQLLDETVSKYFVDYQEHQEEFYPLFLMNDILRYWYTLTLNYEYRRDDKDSINKRNWKRLKLKYARLITCFSMLACLYHKNVTPDYVTECIKMTPPERMDKLALENEKISGTVKEIKTEYEWYLNLRQSMDNGFDEKEQRKSAFMRAEKFHELVVHRLMGELSQNYPQLRLKTDTF